MVIARNIEGQAKARVDNQEYLQSIVLSKDL